MQCSAVQCTAASSAALHRKLLCDVVCCAVVWCVVLCCVVPKALLLEGNGIGTGKREGCVSKCAMCASVLLYHRNALPHCLEAMGSATPAMHCLIACGQWAVKLLQCSATLPVGSGQCNSCNALPHCLWAMGSVTRAMHCLTVWGHFAVELLQCTATLPGGSGQCNSCNALPDCLGSVGSGTRAMHCLTTWGQWAVELLQCNASLPAKTPPAAAPACGCTIGVSWPLPLGRCPPLRPLGLVGLGPAHGDPRHRHASRRGPCIHRG